MTGFAYQSRKMTPFEIRPAPDAIQCAWCAYQRGESTEALVVPWLAQRLGQPPQTLGIRRDAHGRPHLTGCTNTDVNWSHSGQMLLVAFGHEVQLGVDIEYQRPRVNSLALAERFFAPTEAAQLRALPEAARTLAFTRLWCAKEALLKAHGQGISYGLDRLVLTLDGDDWRLVHCQGALAPAQDWTLHSFTPRPGYLAAIAWRNVVIAADRAGQQADNALVSHAKG